MQDAKGSVIHKNVQTLEVEEMEERLVAKCEKGARRGKETLFTKTPWELKMTLNSTQGLYYIMKPSCFEHSSLLSLSHPGSRSDYLLLPHPPEASYYEQALFRTHLILSAFSQTWTRLHKVSLVAVGSSDPATEQDVQICQSMEPFQIILTSVGQKGHRRFLNSPGVYPQMLAHTLDAG